MYFRPTKVSLSLWFSYQTLYVSLLSAVRATCTAHPILCDLITPKNLVRSTDYKFSHYAKYSGPLLPLFCPS